MQKVWGYGGFKKKSSRCLVGWLLNEPKKAVKIFISFRHDSWLPNPEYQLTLLFVVNSRKAIAWAIIGLLLVFNNPKSFWIELVLSFLESKDLDCIGVLSFFKDLFTLFSTFSRQWKVKLEWWFQSRWNSKGNKKEKVWSGVIFKLPLK